MAAPDATIYGKRLLPHILDSLARSEPDRIIYTLASFPDQDAHFQTITTSAFVKAVDKTAWCLHEQLKGRREPQEIGNGKQQDGSVEGIVPIGYIGPRKLDWIH